MDSESRNQSWSIDEVVARAQALSSRLLADKPNASVEAFLAERRREAERE
jgi:hypothetical protein